MLRRASSKTNALEDADVRHAIGDVGDAPSVRRATSGQDVVIHAAAGVTGSAARPGSYEINVAGTRNVVDACLGARVDRLVHVSSIAAIGVPQDETPANEDFVFNLDRSKLDYHISKHRAEAVVREGAARGVDAVIAESWIVVGTVRRRVSGKRHRAHGPRRAASARLARRRLHRARRGRRGRHRVGDGARRPGRPVHPRRRQPHVIASGMTKIAAALGVRPRFVPFPGIAIDLLAMALGAMASIHPRFHGPYLRTYFAGRHTFYDSSKAAKELGYRPRSFDAILDECASHLRF